MWTVARRKTVLFRLWDGWQSTVPYSVQLQADHCQRALGCERQPSERKEQGSAGHQSRPIQHQSSNHQTLSAPFRQGSVCYSRDGTQYLSVVRYGIWNTARCVRQGEWEFQETYRYRPGRKLVSSAGKIKKPLGCVHKEMLQAEWCFLVRAYLGLHQGVWNLFFHWCGTS